MEGTMIQGYCLALSQSSFIQLYNRSYTFNNVDASDNLGYTSALILLGDWVRVEGERRRVEENCLSITAGSHQTTHGTDNSRNSSVSLLRSDLEATTGRKEE